MRRMRWGSIVLGTFAGGLLLAAPAQGFGTVNGLLGQKAEHERITRAALACAPGEPSTGDCFEPRSLDQLAGRRGTFGAVGAPDYPVSPGESGDSRAHCDDADYLAIPGYPQTRAVATGQLFACVEHLKMRFRQARDAAGALLVKGAAVASQVSLNDDCPFDQEPSGRAKCDVLEGFGRALHGAQDFYSHSNWSDQSPPGPHVALNDPPGLGLPAPSPILNLRSGPQPVVPPNLTTGYYAGALSDRCPGDSRVTHACLNKDHADIDPVTGVAAKDVTSYDMFGMLVHSQTARGRVLDNEQKAVTGAIVETRRQWADLQASMRNRYGTTNAKAMILALTQDSPYTHLRVCQNQTTTTLVLKFDSSKFPTFDKWVRIVTSGNQPKVLVLNRAGAPARRVRNLLAFARKDGSVREEYPPAFGRGRANGTSNALVLGTNPTGWEAARFYVPEDESSSYDRALRTKLRSYCNGVKFTTEFAAR